MDLLQTLLVYMSLVFATSVQTAPEPSQLPETQDYAAAYLQVTPEPTVAATPVPTIDITPNPAYKTLQVGDKGANVREMQEKLKEYGFYQGEIDGAFGNQTRQAVEHFQYVHGLTADGIAGRRTLTVLYESPEIRSPQGGQTTEPTPQAQLSVAITLAPTPVPEPTGTPVPVLTATPVPAATPAPTAEAVPIEEMSGYSLMVNENAVQAKLYCRENTVYVPVLMVLREAGVNVISSTSVELDEYAFAVNFDLVRFTHTEDQEGRPVDLQVYRNGEPQLVPDRSLYEADGVLYIPLQSLEKMASVTGTIDDEQKLIAITNAAE